MNLLLDTHIWLSSAQEPERLHDRVSTALIDEQNVIWISPISVWEALTLAALGKIDLGADPVAWIRRALRDGPWREAPLTHEIVTRCLEVDLATHDPGDRLIVATARTLDFVLVTSDKRLIAAKSVPTLSNR